jgi:apolipoprotein N-acyltransferase
MAYIWGFSDIMTQSVSVYGSYILGFITIVIFSSPFIIVNLEVTKNSYKKKKHKQKYYNVGRITNIICIDITKNKLISFGTCLLLLPTLYFFGLDRIKYEKFNFYTGKIARIVQPNIKQDEKWDTESRISIIKKQLKMSSYNSNDIDLVIWPEVAIPYILDTDTKIINFINDSFPKNITLVTGGLRAEYENGAPGEISRINKLWNSAFVLRDGKIINYYDKIHLVPFGEYAPLRRFLPFINKITYGSIDFSRGKERKIINVDEVFNVRFLVCYEAIFSNEILGYQKEYPNLIINLTNDAWFGTTSGPHQHLISVKFRAVEYGVPIIRAANTGISAFIDSFGKVVDKLDLNVENHLDVEISGNLNKTLYSRYKNFVPLFFLYFLGLIIIRRTEK